MEIKEIYLLSDNLPETAAFYANVLGCQPLSGNDYSVSLQFGNTKVVFYKSNGLAPFYHIAFDIPENQLEEAYDWVKMKTPILPVTANSDFSNFTSWNARSFYFCDNNGSILEFICRHELMNRSNKPFTSRSILNASEVGIVTDDVISFSGELTEKYGLEFYNNTVHNDFAALGDTQGLMIVVKRERSWYPTDKASQRFWTKIIFAVEEEDFELVVE